MGADGGSRRVRASDVTAETEKKEALPNWIGEISVGTGHDECKWRKGQEVSNDTGRMVREDRDVASLYLYPKQVGGQHSRGLRNGSPGAGRQGWFKPSSGSRQSREIRAQMNSPFPPINGSCF